MPNYITPGITFGAVPPDNAVTADRLNAHVANLTILPSFVSSQPAGTPVATDKLLGYSVSGTILTAPTISAVLALQISDAAAGTPSMRTLGTGANQAAPGTVDAAVGVGSVRTLGTGAQQAAQGNLVGYLQSSNNWSGAANTFKHIKGTAGVTVAVGAAAGTGGNVSLDARATDISGVITLSCGTSTTASAILFTVTFGSAYTNAPHVAIIPVGATANALFATANKYPIPASTTTTFTVSSDTVALSASTTYKFMYIVFGS